MIVAYVGTKCFEVKRGDYFTDEEKYSLVDKGVADEDWKQFSTKEASTMEADVATATEALTLAEKEGRR